MSSTKTRLDRHLRGRRPASSSPRKQRRLLLETLERRELLTGLIWSNGPALPAPRTDAVAVVTSDKAVRLLGGDAALPTAAPVLAFNGTSWSTGPKTDTPRNDLGAVQSGDSVYLFGGTGNTEGSGEALSYDYRLGDSQDLAQMNQIRYDHGFAVDGSGRAYAIGGIGVQADGEIWSSAERYDASSGVWTAIAPLPRAAHGISAIGDGQGHVFVFGGASTMDDSGIQNATYRYDIATGNWSTMAPMPTGVRDSAAVIDPQGTIYVIGGMARTGPSNAVQVYDPAINAWTSETPLPTSVYSHAAAYDSVGQIIVAGGFDATGTPTAEVIRTQALTISETAPVITTAPIVSASLDQPYTYDVDATGNPTPAYSLVTAPAGMTINETTGRISWQPVAGQLGQQAVTIRASNAIGANDQSFDIAVVADTISPTAPTNVVVDTVTETTATLGWAAATDAVGVDHYEVSKAVYTGPRFGKHWVYTVLDTVTSPSSTITGLTPLSSTRLSVQAFDAAGNASPHSTPVVVTTLAAPDLRFQYGTQNSGAVQSPAHAPLEIQLLSRANPAATFSLVTGPSGMLVDPNTGVVQWTPTAADVGQHTVTFRASNTVGFADLDVVIDVISDAPQLSVAYNPTTGGQRHALAGTLFTAQIADASSTPSVFSLVTAPPTMTIDANSGLIQWTPKGTDGGVHSVTVHAANAGGVADLTFDVNTLFTGAVNNVAVTGATLLHPTVAWTPPTGEGSDLVTSYKVNAFTRYRYGSHTYSYRTHSVDYVTPAGSESVLLTGLLTGKSYTITITPVDAAGHEGLADNSATVTPVPALPQVRWTVNGFSGGSSVPGSVIAGQPADIHLSDQLTDPSTIQLVSGPASLTFDAAANTASWTPGTADVSSGYSTTDVTFRATNSVGSVDVVVPIHVLFSGAVSNLQATKSGNTATASWDPPSDNITPVDAYRITMHWKWSSRNRSRSWTVPGSVTSTTFGLVPTGAVWHKGISIEPLDAAGNSGASSGLVLYGTASGTAPVAVGDSYQVVEDVPLVIDASRGVLANDTDADGDALTARLVGQPAHGAVALAANGSFTYTPDANYHGTDSFAYYANDGRHSSTAATVAITVDPVNDAPAALYDYYSTSAATPLQVAASAGLLANDHDIDNDPLSAVLVASPADGTLTLNSDGSFDYVPNAGFGGVDTFTYMANDGTLDSNVATVSVTVNPASPPTPQRTFFTVDIGKDRVYEYASQGTPLGDTPLDRANKKPMGIATDPAGTKTWIVDKKRKVYVYDQAGGLLGSWTAQGLSKPEGIATDGESLWIVDRGNDRVYFYAGGAAWTDGTRTPDSSFALTRGNRNARGITTDGTHLWVVNNRAAKDEVFQYDLTGQLVGRWQIDAANSTPSGITIDPNNVQHVWIVDSGTDRVYQYDNGATATAGQLTASASFALAAGNTNPQGIADPLQVDVPAETIPAWETRDPAALPSSSVHWENPLNRFDANDDDTVSPLDALLVINHLNSGAGNDVSVFDGETPFLDVTADGWVTPRDVLEVINELNRQTAGQQAAATDGAIVALAEGEPVAPPIANRPASLTAAALIVPAAEPLATPIRPVMIDKQDRTTSEPPLDGLAAIDQVFANL